MAVEVELTRRLFTVEEYHRMAEAGIFRPDERIEPARLVKARLYARAGIAELWLLLAQDGAIEVHRAPGPDGYAGVTRHGPDQTVSPLAFPAAGFAVADFFA